MDLQPLTVESDESTGRQRRAFDFRVVSWGLADASRHGRRGQSAIDRPRDKADLGALWSYATHKTVV
jgi:hypothetical protein